MRAIGLWIVGTAAMSAAAGAAFGPLGAICAAGLGSLYLLAFAWLPRAAHASFKRGDYPKAARLFRAAGAVRIVGSARRSAQLSVGACELGAGRWTAGLHAIEKLTADELPAAERAVFDNNVAYALARLGTRTSEAVGLAERALEERPAMRGFLHTRGIALLADGRLDDAITALEAAYLDSDNNEVLEAERCYDLARAWSVKGEHEYACDYFHRAHRAAPDSKWAELSATELAGRDAPSRAPSIADIV